MDQTYQTYLNQLMRMTLPEAYQAQAQHIQESPKFTHHPETGWKPSPFPGYTVITPPASEDSVNASLYEQLTAFQAQLTNHLRSDLFVPLPPESFHLTLADLIWERAFELAVAEHADYEATLRQRIGESFQACQGAGAGPIEFVIPGLILMARAIGVGLVAANEADHERLLTMRRAIYQNPDVIAIGIEQQYHFTAHITLGYFGQVSDEDRMILASQCDQLNQTWLAMDHPNFVVHRAELRRFADMTAFVRAPEWPVLEF